MPPLFGPPNSEGLIELCPTQKRTARKTNKIRKKNNKHVASIQHVCCFSD
jgi:hypothetical protein